VLHVGAMGVMCSIMWFFLVYDSPAQHPRISDEEREYIEKALNTKDRNKVSFCEASFRLNCIYLYTFSVRKITHLVSAEFGYRSNMTNDVAM